MCKEVRFQAHTEAIRLYLVHRAMCLSGYTYPLHMHYIEGY